MDFEGRLGYQLRQERVKLVQVVRQNKVTEAIYKRSIEPVLAALEEIYDDALRKVGQAYVEELKGSIFNVAPSGRTYEIYEIDESVPKGEGRWKLVGEHTASQPGSLPAKLTGSLVDSIGFRVYPGGLLMIGQLVDETGTELPIVWYKAGKIFIKEGAPAKPVREYGNILEDENYEHSRPWFAEAMLHIREDLRDNLRQKIWSAVQRKTKSQQIRKALVIKIYMTKK